MTMPRWAAENARPVKMQAVKLADQTAGHETAGL